MLIRLSLGICILFAFVLVGCTNSETTSTNSSANSNKPAATTSPATASHSPASATSSSTAEKVGVAECDDFIAKYDACVSSRVPEAVRGQYRASIETWRSQWAKLAANPQTKPSLVQACKTVLEQQKTAMKSFNCTF